MPMTRNAASFAVVRVEMARQACACLFQIDRTPHTVRMVVTWLPYAADAPIDRAHMRLMTFVLRGQREWRLADVAPLTPAGLAGTVYSVSISVDGWPAGSAELGVQP